MEALTLACAGAEALVGVAGIIVDQNKSFHFDASLEDALAALLERCDAHAARLDACEARAVAPPPPPVDAVAADTQTELVVDAGAKVLAVSRPTLSPRAAPFEPSEGVAEYKAAPEDVPTEGVRESKTN